MQQLDIADVSVFLNRFNHFNDAVLESVEWAFSEDGSGSAIVRIQAQDSEKAIDEGWANVALKMLRVVEFRLHERSKTSIQVLSHGLHICEFDSVIALEFGGLIDEPEQVDEVRASDAYFLGVGVEYQVD